MSDSNLSLALTGPLVRDAAPRWCCIRRTVLTLSSLLIGLGILSLYGLSEPSEDVALTAAWHLTHAVPRNGRLMQPLRGWDLPESTRIWRHAAPLGSFKLGPRLHSRVNAETHTAPDVFGDDRAAPQSKITACPGESGLVTKLTGLDEFQHAQQCDPGRILVFKFVAPHCPACKLVGQKISKMAQEFPDMRFFEINYADSQDVFKSLRINRLPFVEMHRGAEGKLEELVIPPRNAHILKDKLLSLSEAA
eukprot:gnl/TRDRNA2_/TRDRNA2_160655_c0_seq1.p1 gnl/TRDRNA2_/TRDRNA2_160655_c0~~gnl/TRDRNA2_/TRDRNA2_160655_c0_seq1.p1  ORF type:complete len:249 (+),score=38.16 gnl/TRDRNA2_/TRDRNA2_160655_c0_seq1:2-748(+)